MNDTCGHTAGDELLKQISRLLLSKIRKQDLLARLGGDEFGLILADCNIENGVQIAENIRQEIYNYNFSWKNNSFSLGISMGLVPFNAELSDYHRILMAADSACYAAKDDGRNRINVYQPDDDELSKRKGEMSWIPKINKALKNNSLNLYVQPIKALNIVDSHKHGEILLRMVGDEGQMVPPNAFIPAAERYSKMQARHAIS